MQRANYGRLLEGRPDALTGFILAPLAITDPQVVRISGEAVHTIARHSGDPGDVGSGTVYFLTPTELAATDAYEVDAYARRLVRLASGIDAFVYTGPDA